MGILAHSSWAKASSSVTLLGLRAATAFFKTDLPVRIDPCGFPASHQSGEQPQDQRRAIKKHVEPVRDQTQAVGPDPVEQFHKCECLQIPEIATIQTHVLL